MGRPSSGDGLPSARLRGRDGAVIGKGGRHIARSKASIMSFATRFQRRFDPGFPDEVPQWTVGKNFDATVPSALLRNRRRTAPAARLHIQTRLNARWCRMHDRRHDFDVAAIISILSEAITLSPGDILVTALLGVGRRASPVVHEIRDVCEVELEMSASCAIRSKTRFGRRPYNRGGE